MVAKKRGHPLFLYTSEPQRQERRFVVEERSGDDSVKQVRRIRLMENVDTHYFHTFLSLSGRTLDLGLRKRVVKGYWTPTFPNFVRNGADPQQDGRKGSGILAVSFGTAACLAAEGIVQSQIAAPTAND